MSSQARRPDSGTLPRGVHRVTEPRLSHRVHPGLRPGLNYLMRPRCLAASEQLHHHFRPFIHRSHSALSLQQSNESDSSNPTLHTLGPRLHRGSDSLPSSGCRILFVLELAIVPLYLFPDCSLLTSGAPVSLSRHPTACRSFYPALSIRLRYYDRALHHSTV